MNERDIERHIATIVRVIRESEQTNLTHDQQKQMAETVVASGTALATNVLVNLERAATAIERIADRLEERNK